MTLKIELVHVPYKGVGPALTALLGNEVSALLSTYASALPHVKSDRLRAYAVTSARRAETLPDVPTVAESGVPGYEYGTWYGLLAPTGTPRAIVEKLNQATVGVLNSPKTRERSCPGPDPDPSTPPDSRNTSGRDREVTKVVRANILPQ